MRPPVDVLALWDREIQAFRNTGEVVKFAVPERKAAYAEHIAALVEARAAIAELFEAGWSLLAGEPGDEEWERFEAALARCGAGA